ncbi:zgpat [Symbiodinium microadriaticum]|nr:zgpat [Symbiodinium microadriaticum]
MLKPIEALTVLPQGVSLDFIHETKEERQQALRSDDAMKETRRRKKRHGVAGAGAGAQQTAPRDVFDFMNATFGSAASQSQVGTHAVNEGPAATGAAASTKSAGKNTGALSLLSLGEGEQKLEKRLEKLRESLQRNKDSEKILSEQLRAKICSTEKELSQLRSSRTSLKSQMDRKQLHDKTKLKKLF